MQVVDMLSEELWPLGAHTIIVELESNAARLGAADCDIEEDTGPLWWCNCVSSHSLLCSIGLQGLRLLCSAILLWGERSCESYKAVGCWREGGGDEEVEELGEKRETQTWGVRYRDRDSLLEEAASVRKQLLELSTGGRAKITPYSGNGTKDQELPQPLSFEYLWAEII